jgi:hypothetical protein
MNTSHPRIKLTLTAEQQAVAQHQYRDMLITVCPAGAIIPATSKLEPLYDAKPSDGSYYHCYAKQLVEVLDRCGTVFIIGYLPIGIRTLRLAELQELFPTTPHCRVGAGELITEWKLPASA